ncbi:MAG: 30S ribosomal protein S2 [Rubrobacter sp.]|nr:30S ribosomal protein S2 [Rubrobacter sp.]
MQDTSGKVGIRDLLEAGVHFGHQAKRWNPKMKKYIFAERAGVHIIDLDQTLTLLDKSLNFIRSIAEAKRDVLFVGTKKQAQITLAEEAIRSGQPYVAERYIGGMLTNFQTIQPRIEYFKGLSARIEETPEEDKSGKDWFALSKEYQKLRRNFAGLTEMARLPGAVFIVDPKREELLVKEANRLRIPVVALTDSNCDPEVVDYVIPGNDDAIRAIGLISRLIADAVISGRGEDIVPAEERPVPPVVEEAKASEEESEERAAQPDAPASANGASAEPSVVGGTNGNGAAEPPSVGTIGDVALTPAPSDAEAEAQVEAQEDAEAEEEAEAIADASAEAPSEEAPAEEAPSDEAPSEEAPSEVSAEEAVEEEAEAKSGEVVEPEEASGHPEDAAGENEEEEK